MANLSFNLVDGVYVATQQVSSDFNIHLQSTEDVSVKYRLLMSTVQNGTPVCKDMRFFTRAFDEDYECKVFPKFLTIEVSHPVEGTLALK